MNRKKNWLWYLIYAVIFLCYIFFTSTVLEHLKDRAALTYNSTPLLIWSMVLFIGLGILLGLEKLISDIRKAGKWKINVPKILILGIPALYFSLGFFIYLPNESISAIITYPIYLLLKTDFIPIFQMILGYIVITSFYKSDRV